MEDIRQVHDEKFAAEIEKLINFAEDSRLAKSKQYDLRRRLSFVATMIIGISASSWLIWFLLMGGSAIISWAALAVLIIAPILLHIWIKQPVKTYISNFKSNLMPRMAKLLGNLEYHPTSGISMKAVASSRLIPPHKVYKAEDAFRGVFKGVKIMISESRLYGKNDKDVIFSGVYVLLLTPKGKFKGHTIITCDDDLIKTCRSSRWKKLPEIQFNEGIKPGLFRIYSNNAEEAKGLADEDFMELLHTLNELFGNTKVSACFYGDNRVFLSIPNDTDMFEPGNIYMPITTRSHALKCKREIEQILHVVDVLDVYEADSATPQNKMGEDARDTVRQAEPLPETPETVAPTATQQETTTTTTQTQQQPATAAPSTPPAPPAAPQSEGAPITMPEGAESPEEKIDGTPNATK